MAKKIKKTKQTKQTKKAQAVKSAPATGETAVAPSASPPRKKG